MRRILHDLLQVELTLHIEKLLPGFLRERWSIVEETLEPNKRSHYVVGLLTNESTMRNIADRVVANNGGDQIGGLHARQVGGYILIM